MTRSHKTETSIANIEHLNPYDYIDDEIDLKELLKVVWAGKWFVVICCSIAVVGSMYYALNAQQWWVSKGEVIKPSLNDVAVLYEQSRQINDVLGESASKSTVKKFKYLPNQDNIFSLFIKNFNYPMNKSLFLKNNAIFVEYLHKNEIKNMQVAISEQEKISYRLVLNEWMENIKSTKNKDGLEAVSLTFKGPSQLSSALLLKDYIKFISQKVKDYQYKKFKIYINSESSTLIMKQMLIKEKAKNELALLIKKTKYAYQISTQSKLLKYQPMQMNDNSLFPVFMGRLALKEELVVLNKISDLSVIDHSLIQINLTLNALNNFKISEDYSFVPFHSIDDVDLPLHRAAPKRALIVVLSTLLTLMMTLFILFSWHFIRTGKTE